MRKIIVMHGGYGCDSGCCGHYVEIDDGSDDYGRRDFVFDHPDPDESDQDFAKRMITQSFGEDHVADMDWENCMIGESTCF
jgi:hypothetical protein